MKVAALVSLQNINFCGQRRKSGSIIIINIDINWMDLVGCQFHIGTKLDFIKFWSLLVGSSILGSHDPIYVSLWVLLLFCFILILILRLVS